MLGSLRGMAAAAAAASLVVSASTALAAPDVRAPARPVSTLPQDASPWLALSAMTAPSAATVAAAADQNEEDAAAAIPFAPLAVALGTIATAIYILLHDDDRNVELRPQPVSPS